MPFKVCQVSLIVIDNFFEACCRVLLAFGWLRLVLWLDMAGRPFVRSVPLRFQRRVQLVADLDVVRNRDFELIVLGSNFVS